jgi:succinate dehydrogenase assembly factor 2
MEVDVLLGTWASINVNSLTLDELNQFEDFVNLETIDIYNIITLRTDVPLNMKTEDESGVVEKIQAWARSSPLGQQSPEKYLEAKREHNLI